MDVLLLAYLAYLLLHLLFIRNIGHEPAFVVKGICLVCGYLLIRHLYSPKLVLVSKKARNVSPIIFLGIKLLFSIV